MGQRFLNVVYGVIVTPEISRSFCHDVDGTPELIELSGISECADLETGDGFEYLGFSIATSGYAELEYEVEIDHVPMRLSRINSECERGMTIVGNKWHRFARWAFKERKIVLPQAELMLAKVERA